MILFLKCSMEAICPVCDIYGCVFMRKLNIIIAFNMSPTDRCRFVHRNKKTTFEVSVPPRVLQRILLCFNSSLKWTNFMKFVSINLLSLLK